MTTAFAAFQRVVADLAPETAIVLGSGLNRVATGFRAMGSLPYGDVPGLVPTTVRGHAGHLDVGFWNDVPTILFFGRLHFYEGHPCEVVARPVQLAADLGAKRLVLTNAAGGINPTLTTGNPMLIRGHFKLVGNSAWRDLAAGKGLATPYSDRSIRLLQDAERESGRDLVAGVYAALTGPCYETPAEIRALAAFGADAVGMSTATEAEVAAELGLEVVGLSCITNAAAGLGAGSLDHAEVLANAKLGVERLGKLLGRLVQAA